MRIVTLPSSLSHCKCIMSSTLFLESINVRAVLRENWYLVVLTRSWVFLPDPKAIIQPQKIALDLEIWVNKRYRD